MIRIIEKYKECKDSEEAGGTSAPEFLSDDMGALEGPRLSGTERGLSGSAAPIPESLKPPHGDDGSLRWWQLIHTMPATTPCALAPDRTRYVSAPRGSGSFPERLWKFPRKALEVSAPKGSGSFPGRLWKFRF